MRDNRDKLERDLGAKTREVTDLINKLVVAQVELKEKRKRNKQLSSDLENPSNKDRGLEDDLVHLKDQLASERPADDQRFLPE